MRAGHLARRMPNSLRLLLIFAATLPPEYDATERKDYLRFGPKAETAATGVSELRAQYADPLRALLAISDRISFPQLPWAKQL